MAQVKPPNPHEVVEVPAWQTLDESQQPFGHVLLLQGIGEQTWVTEEQVSFGGHAVQLLPPPPQAVATSPATQMFWTQHPVQFEALHVAGTPPEAVD